MRRFVETLRQPSAHAAIVGLLFLASVMLPACVLTRPPPAGGGFLSRELIIGGITHRYQVFVPLRSARAGKPPVILFLHGSGERGDDGVKATMVGLGPYVRAHAREFPALVVFPQAADNSEWMGANVNMAMAMLDAATREFGGDQRRTILTGMSMGGYGTWEIALKHPTRFAALVPVCGAIKPPDGGRALYVTDIVGQSDPYAALAARLRDVPIWIFHGAKDDVVPPDDDRRLAAAFAAGGAKDARYTEFPDANHNAWDPAYATPALWDWLWAQRRR